MKINQLKIYGLFLIIVMIYDIFFQSRLFFIHVNEDYILSIFSALFTISALSVTVLTIVVNTLDSDNFGFSLKEILNLDNGYLKISLFVTVIMGTIVFGMIFLTFEMVNSMSTLLVLTLVLIIQEVEHTWKLIIDRNYVKSFIDEEINKLIKDDKVSEKLITNLFYSFKASITTSGLSNTNEHIEIVNKILNNKKTVENKYYLITKHLESTFDFVTNNFGYVPAIENIVKLLKTAETDEKSLKYDILDIILNPIKEIEFFDNNKFSRSKIFDVVNNLENINELNDVDKINILYWIISSTISNEIISSNTKMNIVSKIIDHLTKFYSKEFVEYEHIKQKVLYLIIKQLVLSNKNQDIAQEIFIIVTEMLNKNKYFKNEIYIQTIAIIYLMIYINGNFEKDVYNNSHREFIKEIIKVSDSKIYNNFSFQTLIITNLEKIVNYLFSIEDEIIEDYIFFESRSPYVNIKTVVWQESNIIRFIILNYFMFCIHNYSINSKIIETIKENSKSSIYVKEVLNCFDPIKEEIKLEIQKDLYNFSKWIGISGTILPYKQEEIFKFFNRMMDHIEDKKINIEIDNTKQDLKYLNEEVTKLLSQASLFYGFNNEISLENSKVYEIKPFIEDKEMIDVYNEIPKIITYFVEDIINQSINDNMTTIEVDFDLKGVKELSKVIKTDYKFDYRNYTYVDDWAIKDSTKNSKHFMKLEQKIYDMEFIDTKQINAYIFFKKNALDFNVEVVKYDIVDLTDEDSSKFVEKFRINEILYKIENAYVEKSKAIDKIKLKYKKVCVALKFYININETNSIRIIHKY